MRDRLLFRPIAILALPVALMAVGWIGWAERTLGAPQGAERTLGAPQGAEGEVHWAFQPPRSVEVPLSTGNRVDHFLPRNGIDLFISRKLRQQGLSPAPQANRRVLMRRVYFDLIGLPPTPSEVDAFLANSSSRAYEELVDRLLADPRYGERWARHWLDLARYADTAGYEGDPERPHVWRYRDYVIDAMNDDKPYDLFIKEQIAGDEFHEHLGAGELPLTDPEKVVALGFLRMAPFTEPRGDETRHELLSEMTATVGSVFLGITLDCAKCHDHKYDPIPAKDFYRMKAFFETVQIPPPLRGDIMQLGGSMAAEFYRPGEKEWADTKRAKCEHDLKPAEEEFATLQKALQEKLTAALDRDEPVELKEVKTSVEDEANKTVSVEEKRRFGDLSRTIFILKNKLRRLQPVATSLTHSLGPPYGPSVPASYVMLRGEWNHRGEVVEPGFLSCITGDQQPARIRLDPFKRYPTRSRRMALAEWITSSDNPLTSRVMVNRIWQHHFGRGIVGTPSDFGDAGERPTHPELLDWLALRFVDQKWSIKAMHRLILTSSTYRQSSQKEDSRAVQIDPENELLWRFRRQRLEAEVIRDSILAVSGRLNHAWGGLPVFPPLPEGLDESQKVYGVNTWETSHDAEGLRRSIYIFQRRAMNMPMMDTFDALVSNTSCAQRRNSITPLQSLSLYNGEFANTEANYFANRIRNSSSEDPEDQIDLAFQIALSRSPTAAELEKVQALVGSAEPHEDSLLSLCRILLNVNEFVYID